MNIKEIRVDFKNIFNCDFCECFFSPGRVNLIGEHIDYSGGKVMPFSLSIGTYAFVSFRDDLKISCFSSNFRDLGVITFDIDSFEKNNTWVDYVKGIVNNFQNKGLKIDKGLNIYIVGMIPASSGLSSSASLELLIGSILNDVFDFKFSAKDLAIIGKEVENDYIGVACGIMDQFIIGLGKKDKVMLLNTDTLDYSYVPMVLNDYVVLIMNTNKKRNLTDSKYNERRSECDIALNIIKKHYNINNLCDLKVEELEKIKGEFEEVIYRRALHAVSEEKRVLDCFEALASNDLNKVGKLLDESHFSLKDNYEVSCFELDTITSLARDCDSVIGARMTGAGFGGCAIALVKKDKVEEVTNYVLENYKKLTNLTPSFYVCTSNDGAKRIKDLNSLEEL